MEQKLYTPNKNHSEYNLWMAYPACESFALSSLGYLWLYKIADTMEGISVERVYTDSNNRLTPCNAMSFSMSFDFDFMGVFEILEKHSIPFLSKDRDDSYPLIFAGGPVLTTNPEPYKNFFDFMIIGDGEEVFIKVLNTLKQNLDKTTTLQILSEMDGIYIPNLTKTVKKNTVDLKDVIYTPIINDNSYFKDTFIIEVARGCMNRCAFCTASYTNLPFRQNDYDQIINAIDLGLKYTNKIALLGAQVSAHSNFNDIIKYLNDKIDKNPSIEFGISSLRTDSVTPELVKFLVKGGQKTSTIAIEAASERLRKFINKNLKEEQILDAVKISRENGLKGLKIYSMIGLPTETENDIEEFLRLGKKIKEENKGFNITFSFSTFVPKPQTPLQWSKREDTKSLEKKQKYLEKEFAKLGIETKFSSAKWDYWQTVLSRGDESLTQFLIDVYKNGGKNSAYKTSLKQNNIDVSKFINGCDFEEQLAWDFIESCPSKQLLINEAKRLSKFSN